MQANWKILISCSNLIPIQVANFGVEMGSVANILGVDDDQMNHEILQEILDSKYKLHCVYRGEEAYDFVLSKHPDLILLDINLPKMNGIELCKKIKQQKETANTQIIFMSASASDEDIRRGMAAGADYYLPKPFNEDQLLQSIEKILNKTSQTCCEN